MGKKLRKFNRATHRDLGYLFVGMIIIYSLSGIAINHLDDWDPNYVINNYTVTVENLPPIDEFTKADAKKLLDEWNIDGRYRKFYRKGDDMIKIFFKGGTAVVIVSQQQAHIETIKRRPVFHAVNWMHYNPNRAWMWFSDIFAVALIILAISGMFILRGKNGLKWRGTILISIGIIIPLIYLVIYYF
jgi:hypothetical protein